MEQALLHWIDALQGKRIMVLGDMVADVYLEGRISRISREAPVLVLEHQADVVVPGGAANAVHNVVALGGKTYGVGVIGEDNAGTMLCSTLAEKGVIVDGFIEEKSRPTITKTRVMAGGQATVRQQIVRIDKEKKEPLVEETEERLLQYLKTMLPQMEGVIISDYGSHTVSEKIKETVVRICCERQIPCMVDSRYDIMTYPGVTLIKQNENEAAAAVGFAIDSQERLREAGQFLLKELQAEAVLITLGPKGMALVQNDGSMVEIPVTNKSEVYDVTGAGDTVVATMMLAVAAGASYEMAARLANFAAGVVVRKMGTATTSPRELKYAIGEHFA